MKTLKYIVLIAISAFFVGCANLQTATPYIESASCLAATVALEFGVSDSDRVVKAKCLYGMAAGVRTIMGGKLPTAAELQTYLAAFAINDGQVWGKFSESLSKIYEVEIAKVNGDPKQAMVVIESIARGIEEAAQPYASQM